MKTERSLTPPTTAQSAEDSFTTLEFPAESSSTPATTLLQLIENKHWNLKAAIARNPSASPAVLRILAASDDIFVRTGVARNHNTPSDVLTQLARDEMPIRAVTAGNSNTLPEILTELALDNCHSVRISVSRNPNSPASTLLRLAQDENPIVRAGVARNPNAPYKALQSLATDQNRLVRGGVEQVLSSHGLQEESRQFPHVY